MSKTTKLKNFLPVILASSLIISSCIVSAECCLEQKRRNRQEFVAACKSLFWGATSIASFFAIIDSFKHPQKETQLLLGSVALFISLIGFSSASDDLHEYVQYNHASTCLDHYCCDHDYSCDCNDYCHHDDYHSCHGNCCHDHHDHNVVDHHYHYEPVYYPDVYHTHTHVDDPKPVVSNTYVDQSTYVDATTQTVQQEPQPVTYIDPDSSVGQLGQSVFNVMNGIPS